MLYIFYSVIFIEFFTVTFNLIKFLIYKLKERHSSKIDISNQEPFLVNVLIPCYQETSVIKNTLEHFVKIADKLKNISIYVITTEKEKSLSSGSQTTYEYLLALDLCKSPNVHIINYPKTDGMMADQLNYAIEEILKESNFPRDKIYFSIYNADSNPDSSTYEDLIAKIYQYCFPKILQQYSNYFLNYSKQNFIMKGFSIYQTAFEFRNGLINNKVSGLLYSHVVGHGLTIRADYINEINGFNSNFWCEDIYLTGLLHNNNEKIIALNSLDNSENPERLSTQIVQNAVWFKTASHHFKILNDIKKDYKITSHGLLWLFHEVRATLVWMLMPIFLMYTLIYPLIVKNYKLLLIATCSYLLFTFVNYLLNLIVIDSKRFSKYLKNYFSTCIAILLTGLGPLYSFFLKEKIKTPR